MRQQMRIATSFSFSYTCLLPSIGNFGLFNAGRSQAFKAVFKTFVALVVTDNNWDCWVLQFFSCFPHFFSAFGLLETKTSYCIAAMSSSHQVNAINPFWKFVFVSHLYDLFSYWKVAFSLYSLEVLHTVKFHNVYWQKKACTRFEKVLEKLTRAVESNGVIVRMEWKHKSCSSFTTTVAAKDLNIFVPSNIIYISSPLTSLTFRVANIFIRYLFSPSSSLHIVQLIEKVRNFQSFPVCTKKLLEDLLFHVCAVSMPLWMAGNTHNWRGIFLYFSCGSFFLSLFILNSTTATILDLIRRSFHLRVCRPLCEKSCFLWKWRLK